MPYQVNVLVNLSGGSFEIKWPSNNTEIKGEDCQQNSGKVQISCLKRRGSRCWPSIGLVLGNRRAEAPNFV